MMQRKGTMGSRHSFQAHWEAVQVDLEAENGDSQNDEDVKHNQPSPQNKEFGSKFRHFLETCYKLEDNSVQSKDMSIINKLLDNGDNFHDEAVAATLTDSTYLMTPTAKERRWTQRRNSAVMVMMMVLRKRSKRRRKKKNRRRRGEMGIEWKSLKLCLY